MTDILQQTDFPGRDELQNQVSTANVLAGDGLVPARLDGGPIVMINLAVSGRKPSLLPDGPAPVFAAVSDASGSSTGELLLWIESGYLTGLEYAWSTDNPPTDLPTADQVHVRRTPIRHP